MGAEQRLQAERSGAAPASSTAPTATSARRHEPPDLRQRILRTAWLSILLGLALEGLLILLALGMGNLPGLRPILADTVQKVSWSFIVCVGLVIGTGAAREGVRMGLLGLLAAPFGSTRPAPSTRQRRPPSI